VKIMSMSEGALSWVSTGEFDAGGDPIRRSSGLAGPAGRVSHVVHVRTRRDMSMIISEDGVVHHVLRLVLWLQKREREIDDRRET
jgi:hypothetical protein